MKIYTIGGYNEVGKNMTAVEVKNEIVIFDMGYEMQALIDMENSIESTPTSDARKAGIIPDDQIIYSQREKVKAIVIGHGHLDHVGAIGKLAGAYNCPVIASPYTMKVAETQLSQEKKELSNKRITLEPGKIHSLTSTMAVEFVKVTHSIPDTMLTILHTPEGRFAYGLDFRIDNEPVLGGPPDFKRLAELGNQGIKILIGDSTRADTRGSSTTESAIRDQLRFIFDTITKSPGAIVITTFSSHIERLKSILEVNQNRRKVAFIGRSLKEYTQPAAELGYLNLKDVEVASYPRQVVSLFEKINERRGDWLIVCTGNQGEERSVLQKLSREKYPFKIQPGDHVIFSSSTIPTPVNQAERFMLERNLKKLGATLHLDIHTSGHGHREDLRFLIQTLKPEIMIPGHGDIQKLAAHASLAQEEGYVLNKNLHICENGNTLNF